MLVNFRADGDPSRFYQKPTPKSIRILANEYFAELSRRGYSIDVYQTDYIDFCHPTTHSQFKDCHSYPLETIHSLEHSQLGVAARVRIILGMHMRLSKILSGLSRRGDALGRALRNQLGLPDQPTASHRVSPLSAMRAIVGLSAKLETIEPGEMVFAHLALPHYPFVYRRDCTLRLDPTTWLDGNSEALKPRRNDSRSRAQRYPPYLEQVACTHALLAELFAAMRAAGRYEQSLIVIHGDHGSRIDLGPPTAEFRSLLSERDLVDSFSTLFAVHWPSGTGRRDDRLIPIEALLSRIVYQGRIPADSNWIPPPQVYLERDGQSMLPVTMPIF